MHDDARNNVSWTCDACISEKRSSPVVFRRHRNRPDRSPCGEVVAGANLGGKTPESTCESSCHVENGREHSRGGI